MIADQVSPRITRLGNESFIIIWTSFDSGIHGVIGKGQFYSSNGTAIGNEFCLSTYDSILSVAASTGNGEVMAVWEYNGRDGSGRGIFGRAFRQAITAINDANTYIYKEDQSYLFANNPFSIDVFYNPNINLTLTMSNFKAGILVSINVSNTSTRFDSMQGQWFAYGKLEDVNKLLSHLIYQPTRDFNEDFSIGLHVHDGISPDYTSKFNMQGTMVNDAPNIVNNQLSIADGSTKVVDVGDLRAVDVDNNDSSIIFVVTNISHAQFEFTNNPGVAISKFTLNDIQSNSIQFVHDGTNISPNYYISASDGQLASTPNQAKINFISSNNTASKVNTVAIVSSIVGISVAALTVSIGIWRHRVNRQRARYRRAHPLANKIYKKLNLSRFQVFNSELGRVYVNAIDSLANQLRAELDVKTDNLAPDKLDELADYVIQALEENLEIKNITFGRHFDVSQLQVKSNRIAKSVEKLIREDGWIAQQNPVKEKYDSHSDEFEMKSL